MLWKIVDKMHDAAEIIDKRQAETVVRRMITGQASNVMRCMRRVALLQDGAAPSDAELLDCFIAYRDESAFEALVRRHGGLVWGVCRRVLRNEADAEDAFQATFLVLVRKAASVNPRAMVGNWLYGVAHKTALKAKAMNTLRRTKEKEAEAHRPADCNSDAWSQLQKVLDDGLARLPEKYRTAVVLCELEGKSLKAAARQLGWPQGTVASRLARGREMLSRSVSRRGVTLSVAALSAALTHNAASAAPPAALLATTLKAGMAVTSGATAVLAAVPAQVTLLVDAVVKSMLIAKLKLVPATIVLLVATTLTAGGVFGHGFLNGQEGSKVQNGEAPSDPAAVLRQLGQLPAAVAATQKTNAEVVDELFRAALKRPPTKSEADHATKHLQAAKDRKDAAFDLLWALVNSKEFLKFHGLDRDVAKSLELLNRAAEAWNRKQPNEPNDAASSGESVEDILKKRFIKLENVREATK